MRYVIIAAVLAFWCNAASATPTLPTTVSLNTGMVPSQLGLTVQQVKSSRTFRVNAVFHEHFVQAGDLAWGALFPVASASSMLASWQNENLQGDLDDDWLVYERHDLGGSEIFFMDLTLSPLSPVRLTTSGDARYPATHLGLAAWTEGGSVKLYDLLMGGSIASIGSGTNPSVWEEWVAFEESGDLWAYHDTLSNPAQLFGDPSDIERLPVVGGGRVAYERLIPGRGTQIYFSELSGLASSGTEIRGPCDEHLRPRISEGGDLLLYVGVGNCPDPGVPLYLTYIDPVSNQQTTYLVADLGNATVVSGQMGSYDIDQDFIVFQVDTGASIELWLAQVDVAAL